MLLTILLKLSAHQEITASLERQEYPYIELSTRPTPFNAILWTANVSMDSSFLLGYHSLLDTKPEVDFVSIPKNHALLGKLHDHPDIGRLIRLSQGRYVITRVNDTLIFNDLRFGQMGEPDKDKQFIFSYRLYERQGELQVERIPPPQVDGAEMGKILNDLVERIKGE
jgi:inner membrane protein